MAGPFTMFANRPRFLIPGIIALALSVLLLAALTKGPSYYYNFNPLDPWNTGDNVGAPQSLHGSNSTTAPNGQPNGAPQEPPSPAINLDSAARKRVITTSIFTSHYVPLAMMLGYSLRKHNDVAAMGSDMIAMIRKDDGNGNGGVSNKDLGLLMKAGWQIREIEPLDFKGAINESLILPHHRWNLNKLQIFRWTDYEQLVFIDADCAVRGDISELFRMPGPFAAAPDVWFNKLVDNKFNSGVMVIKPNLAVFQDMMVQLPKIHKPQDGDQPFLQEYWKFRYYGLPYKYNLNMVMFQHHREEWDRIWDEALILHLTTRKPTGNPERYCLPPGEGSFDCPEYGPMGWYAEYYKEMIKALDVEGQVPVLG